MHQDSQKQARLPINRRQQYKSFRIRSYVMLPIANNRRWQILACISKTRYHKRESFNFCELVKKGCLKRKLSRIACWYHQKLSHYQISRRKLSQIATKFVNFSSLKVSCYMLYARLSMADKPGCSKTMGEAASSNSTLMLNQQQLLAPALKQHSLKFTTTMSYIHQLVAISLTGGHP